MEDSNKTPNTQPQPVHEYKAYYTLREKGEGLTENDNKLWEDWEKRLEERKKEYKELLRNNGYPVIEDDYEGWFDAYYHMKEVEDTREDAYERAKLNCSLLECREAIKKGEDKICVGDISLGRSGREWLLDQIENYFFRGNKWIIPYYFMYDTADYDDGEETGDVEAFVLDCLASQERWLRDYEETRGAGRGPYAKHLGRYVLYAMERVPAWAASLTDNEKYRFIGEMMEKAGVLERYRGQDWMRNRWNKKMYKKEQANQIKQWAAAARKK